MKLIIFLSLLIFYYSSSTSGSTVDSLMLKLSVCKTDSEKVQLYNAISIELSNQDPFKAEQFAQQAKNLALKIKYNKGLALAYRNLSLIKFYQVKYSESLEFSDTSLSIYEKINDKSGQASALNLKGLIYSEQGYNEKAMDLYNQCVILRKFSGDSSGLSGSYNNIAIIYKDQHNYTKALDYLQNALRLAEKYDVKSTLGLYLSNIGDIYLITNQPLEAFDAYNKSLRLRIEAKDIQGLANAYRNLGDYYNYIKDSKNAIINFNKSYTLACQIKIGYEIESALKGLSESYRKNNEYKKAYDFYVLYNEQKNKNKTDNVTKKITQVEMNEKFKKERELNVLKQQKKDIEAQRDIDRQKNFRNFALAVIIFFSIILFLLYRNYKNKKRDNFILKKQKDEILQKNIDISQQNEEIIYQRDQLQILNSELLQRNEEITAQRDEIESQRNSITEQKNIIQLQKEKTELIYSELQDSIYYAKKIQQAVLPSEQNLNGYFENYFVLYLPLHIVSGDFYWVHKRINYLFFAVADCTGHGVPGGFMSMLGVSLLNEIVTKTNIIQPNLILNELRDKIIFSLNQRGLSGEQQDGMDIAFCTLNSDTMEMQFAGANNPCWIITQFGNVPMFQFGNEKKNTQEEIQTLENFQISKFPNLLEPIIELVEIKGDKMPIGIYKQMASFTNHKIKLNKGDTIYLKSDGFEDQFGGPIIKKYLAKNLKSLLIANSQQPMADQKEILTKTLQQWHGDNLEIGQVDDITILGIKI